MKNHDIVLQYVKKTEDLLRDIRNGYVTEDYSDKCTRNVLIRRLLELSEMSIRIEADGYLVRVHNLCNSTHGSELFMSTTSIDNANRYYKGFVLFISHEMGRSGAPVVLFDAAKVMKAAGYFVMMLAPMDGPLRKEVCAAGIPVMVDFHLQRGRLEESKLREVHSHQQWPSDAIVRCADTVIANTAVLHSVVERYQDYGMPLIWWLHEGNSSFESFGHCMPDKLNDNVHVVHVCDYVRRQMAASGIEYDTAETADVVSYGVEDFAKTVVFDESNSANDKVQFITVGAIDQRKGQDILLEAINKLPLEYLNKAHFHFVGSPVDYKMYDRLKLLSSGSDYMTMHDGMPRADLIKLYKQCDCIICPSRDDPMPVVLTEMMILSKTSICSDHTGTADYLVDGENAYLFANCDVDKLATAICKAIDHRDKLTQMGIESRKVYEQYLTMDRFEKNWMAMVEKYGDFEPVEIDGDKLSDDPNANYQLGSSDSDADLYQAKLDELLTTMETRTEYQADFERRAHRLSVKKEIERLENLNEIQEKDIEIRKLTDSYNMVVNSKWWKLTSPIRKAYEKMQAKKGQKTMTEMLAEINNNSRYNRIDYMGQMKDVYRNAAKEFAEGEGAVRKVLTSEFVSGSELSKRLSQIKVSVVIPTYNAGPDLRETLSALRGQIGVGEVEIICVDSGSTDQTIAECKLAGAKVIKITQEEFSHSHARNLGAEAATGEYLLFMTQDAMPTDTTWLYRMLSVLSDDVVACSPMEIENGKGDLKYSADSAYHAGYLGLYEGDYITSMPKNENETESTDEKLAYANDIRRNAQLTDVSNLIYRDVFMKYKYDGDYAEDLRLGIKLIKNGYHLALLSSVQVYHGHDRDAEYIQSRSYTDRKALCELLPDLLTGAIGEAEFNVALAQGEAVMQKVISYMREETSQFGNIVVYGRNLEHCIDRVREEVSGDAALKEGCYFLTGVKNYLHHVLMPYVIEHNGAINDNLHNRILDAVYKAYRSEVGSTIADVEMYHKVQIKFDQVNVNV